MSQIENDPGPVPPATEADRQLTTRLQVIAAIHAMAQWLLDHPDAPTPRTIAMNAHPGPHGTPDTIRVAVLDQFHAGHPDSDRYALSGGRRGDQYEYVKVHLGAEDTHGATLTYTLSTTRTTQSGPLCAPDNRADHPHTVACGPVPEAS